MYHQLFLCGLVGAVHSSLYPINEDLHYVNVKFDKKSMQFLRTHSKIKV